MKLSVKNVRSLYHQKSLSAREVAEELGVSVWKIIKFMKKHEIPRRKAAATKRIQFLKQLPSFNIKKPLTPKEEKLRVAGVMIYWAEGNKQKDTVDLANSDPKMIKVFLKFLRSICGVNEEKLRAFVYCYANQNVGKLEKYWSLLTKIPKSQFRKAYVRKDYSPIKKGKMKYGLVHIRYHDQKLVMQIKKWIKQYVKSLARVRK